MKQSFPEVCPNIARWIEGSWIEIGRDDYRESFVRALDIGSMVWEGKTDYETLDEALENLEKGFAEWTKQHMSGE